MHEAGFLADMFGQAGQECDDIMLGFALDLVDSVDIETPRSQTAFAASRGIMPSSAIASQACASISYQI